MVFEYKVTYHSFEIPCQFVRIADNAILYSGFEHDCIMFARGFCQAKNVNFYIE